MVPPRMSSASLATFPTVLVRDFQDGLEVDQVLLVRGAEARAKRDGGEFLRLTLADRTGSVVAMVWDDVERMRVLCPAGAPIHVAAATRPSALRPADRPRAACASPRRARSRSPTCSTARRARPRQMEADLRELVATVQEPHLRALLERVLGEGTPTWELLPLRAGGQALPPGLPARAARALPVGRAGRQRDQRDVPGDRPRRRGHRRAAARHRQARGLHGRPRGDRPDRRRAPAGRDPARLLPDPARDRGASTASRRGSPRRVLHIILSHHGTLEHGSPVVPVHARGDARALPRQPRRPPRLASTASRRSCPPGAAWSGFDRALGAGAFFGRLRGRSGAEDRPGRRRAPKRPDRARRPAAGAPGAADRACGTPGRGRTTRPQRAPEVRRGRRRP